MGANSQEQEQSGYTRQDQSIWGMQTPYLSNLFQSAQLAGRRGVNTAQQTPAWLSGGARNAYQNVAALGDPSQQIATQTEALSGSLGNLWQNEIMPTIQGNSIAAGGLGGGRQGVAEGVAASGMFDAMQQGIAGITQQANQQSLLANTALGQMGQNFLDMRNQQSNQQMDVLGRLAAILGGPTVLSRTRSENQGESSGWGFSL